MLVHCMCAFWLWSLNILLSQASRSQWAQGVTLRSNLLFFRAERIHCPHCLMHPRGKRDFWLARTFSLWCSWASFTFGDATQIWTALLNKRSLYWSSLYLVPKYKGSCYIWSGWSIWGKGNWQCIFSLSCQSDRHLLPEQQMARSSNRAQRT